MFGRFTEFRTWYIVFVPRRGPKIRWWQAFLKKEFSHVFLISGLNNGSHIRFEPLSWGISISEKQLHIEDAVRAEIEHASAVLQVSVDYSGVPADYHPRGIISCVSCAKAVLGIRGARLLMTPYLLYVYLRKGIRNIPKDSHIHVTTIKGFDHHGN